VFGFSGKDRSVYGRGIAWTRGKSNLETSFNFLRLRRKANYDRFRFLAAAPDVWGRSPHIRGGPFAEYVRTYVREKPCVFLGRH
jgi:hypothetical protein